VPRKPLNLLLDTKDTKNISPTANGTNQIKEIQIQTAHLRLVTLIN